MLYILAGDDKQARACAAWLELQPKQWRTLRDGDELRGIDRPKVLQFGTFWRHERFNEIMEICKRVRAFVSSINDRP